MRRSPIQQFPELTAPRLKPLARPMRACVRSFVAISVAVAVMVIVAPADRANACSIAPAGAGSLSILPSDLPTILQPDGTWAERFKADRAESGIEAVPPLFVGAARSEVVDFLPETDTHYEGATWEMRTAWGVASVQPRSKVGRERKDDQSARCYWGTEARLGDSEYWLETDDGDVVTLNIDGADISAIDADLASLFGPPTDVNHDMVTAATRKEASSNGSGVWTPTSPLLTVGLLVGGAVILAALTAGGD